MHFIQLIQTDYKKYKKYGGTFFSIVFLTQGFWAIFQYRIAHFVYRLPLPVFKTIFQFICLLWQKVIEITTGISIPASVQIGHSFYIGHFGGIILNPRTVIGYNCNLSQGVTIGVSGQGESRGVPKLGNNVYVGANAVIVGKIFVGDHVLIGACSLVNTNVAANSVMLGVPAVQVSDKSSEGYI